jgi:hypothetical protein
VGKTERVRDGSVTMRMTTPSMRDICTVGFSPERGRWYFQYEAMPAFVTNLPGTFGEFVGAAAFEMP